MSETTIPSLFLACVERQPDYPSLMIRDDQHPQQWQTITRQQGLELVAGIARRLYSLGVKQGSRVAIVAPTSHHWLTIDLAVQGLGGVVVGIYPTLTAQEIAFQLQKAKVSMLIVEDLDCYRRLEDELDELEDLIYILSLVENDELLPLTPAEADVAFYRQQVAQVQTEQLATIVFTSGTTGESKGVCLSHRNFVTNLQDTKEMVPIQAGERSIICLPLAHVLQRFVVYRGLLEDAQGYFCALSELQETIPQVKPTILLAVPRMLEKIQSAVEYKVAQRGQVAAWLYRWSCLVAKNYHQQEQPGLRLRTQYRAAKSLFFDKVQAALGEHLHTIFCGGAPLSLQVGEWFLGLGIKVIEGWGLSESCAPATINPLRDIRLGTVGQPLPRIELRIAKDGEICIRGAGVFSHYADDPEATKKAFDAEGFFLTGDIGQIDEQGFLRITGRKKSLIITAGGKNIAPAKHTHLLNRGVIAHTIVIGDRRPYLTALLALDPEAIAERSGEVWSGSWQELDMQREISKQVALQVKKTNAKLPSFAQIKHYRILPTALRVETGELTPTLKVKKQVVLQKYAALIEEMYAQ